MLERREAKVQDFKNISKMNFRSATKFKLLTTARQTANFVDASLGTIHLT